MITRNQSWRPATPAERANARRAPTDSATGAPGGLRAKQGGGAAARRLRAK
jgi:hypothetical protein